MHIGKDRALVAGALALVLLAPGCSHSPAPSAAVAPPPAIETTYTVLQAKITPTKGNTCHGTIVFSAQPDGSVKVTADLGGLPPSSKLGIHVHETGDCSAPDAMSAGAHFNPTKQQHGLPPAILRHAGDLGNVTTDAGGVAFYEITVNNLSLSSSGNGILGRAVIVHAMEDTGAQPAGNSGARIGCGVIFAPTPRKPN